MSTVSTLHPLRRPRFRDPNILFRWHAGGRRPDGLQFSRNSPAWRTDIDGVVKRAAADVPRIEWLDLDGDGQRETPVVLSEPATTNRFTAPADITDAAWAKVRTTTPGFSLPAPDGTSPAYKLVEDTSNNTHYVTQNVAIDAAGFAVASTYVMPAQRQRILIAWRDQALTMVARARFTLTGAGSVEIIAPTGGATSGLAHIERVDDFYWCWFSAQLGLETALRCDVELDDGTTNAYQGDGTSGAYFWGLQAEPGKVATRYAGAAPRSVDLLTAPAPAPQIGTWYLRVRELGTIGMSSSARLLEIGSVADPRLLISQVGGDGLYRATLRDADGNQVSTVLTTAPGYGDPVEVRAEILDEGRDSAGRQLVSLQIHQSINGGAEVSAPKSGAIVLPDAWSGPLMAIGSDITGGAHGSMALRDMVFVNRTGLTFDDFRTLLP